MPLAAMNDGKERESGPKHQVRSLASLHILSRLSVCVLPLEDLMEVGGDCLGVGIYAVYIGA
jgi:hypothetical protein